MKKLAFEEKSRKGLMAGVNKMERAVATTLGPLGRNVALDRGFEKIVVHDGVTVAENFQLKDELEEFGASLLRQGAQNQVHLRGDGTTVTTILAAEITRECMKLIEAGYNAMHLRRGLEKSQRTLLKHLDDMVIQIKKGDEKEIIRIATIASNSKELGEQIGKVISKLGIDGIVDVEESKSTETVVEHQEGMQFDNGFASPYFMTDLKRRESTIENPYILISDKNIDNLTEFMPFTQKLIGKPQQVGNSVQLSGGVTRDIVVIAPDFSNDVLAAGIGTKMQNVANILCIRAPFAQDVQKNFLKDLAILTGSTVVGNELGSSFENMEVSVCGHAKRVTATSEATKIVGGLGDPNILEEHVEGLRKELEDESSSFLAEKLKERIGKLTSGVAVIKIGGVTEVEIRDRKEWAIDAIASTKAAIEGGIVPGGEMALFNLSLLPSSQFGDEQSAKILKDALKVPFKKLLSNAGIEYADILGELKEQGVTYGVDVLDGKVKDMIQAGIIDPVLVVRSALEHAISIANQLSTVDCSIVNETPKQPYNPN